MTTDDMVVATICHHHSTESRIQRWDRIADAFAAAAITPCRPMCLGQHTVVVGEGSTWHATAFGSKRRSRAAEIRACYPFHPTK